MRMQINKFIITVQLTFLNAQLFKKIYLYTTKTSTFEKN